MTQIQEDFLRLARLQFVTQDFDAVHPIHLHLVEKLGLDKEQTCWLAMLYMTYYNEGSAWLAFLNTDRFKMPSRKWRMEPHRRNLYPIGARVAHFSSIERIGKDGFWAWIQRDFTEDRHENWRRAIDSMMSIDGNGRWAAYTSVDHLHKVAGLPVEPPDVQNRNSSGPADGIRRIFGTVTKDIDELDSLALRAFVMVRDQVEERPPYAEDLDLAMVESLLCDFSGLARGKFYSGRNVDRMQERMYKSLDGYDKPTDMTPMWEARETVFDRRHLGEHNGRLGIDKPRLKHYKETGEIPWSHENR